MNYGYAGQMAYQPALMARGNNCCCSFPLLIILILIVLQFSRPNYRDCGDVCDDYYDGDEVSLTKVQQVI